MNGCVLSYGSVSPWRNISKVRQNTYINMATTYPSCKKNCKEADLALMCEACGKWWHIKCCGVSQARYDLMKQMIQLREEEGVDEDDSPWYCGTCRGNVLQAMKTVTTMMNRVENLEEKVEKTNCRIDDMDGKFSKEIQTVKDSIRVEVAEQVQREQRKKNLIINGIPEKDEEDENGLEGEVLKILRATGAKKPMVNEVRRLGKHRENRIRPVLVRLEHLQDKITVISKANTELRKAGDKFQGIYINNDLTKEEQEANRKLREEVKLRRQNGQECKILKQQIVDPEGNVLPPLPSDVHPEPLAPNLDDEQEFPTLAGSGDEKEEGEDAGDGEVSGDEGTEEKKKKTKKQKDATPAPKGSKANKKPDKDGEDVNNASKDRKDSTTAKGGRGKDKRK